MMKMKNILTGLLLWCTALPALAQPGEQPPADAKGEIIRWEFPMRRTHAGVLAGNGVQGLMVWGEGRQLNITVGRAGFWDHRGGNDFTTRTNFQQVKTMLQAGNEQGLKKAFDIQERGVPTEERPHQMGGGRVEILLPEGWQIAHADLHFRAGFIKVLARHPELGEQSVRIEQAVFQEFTRVLLPQSLAVATSINLVASWDYVKEKLAPLGVKPPVVEKFGKKQETGLSFMQTLPQDDPLAIAALKRGNQVLVASALGQKALKKAQQTAAETAVEKILSERAAWWASYWAEVPRLHVPDHKVQELFNYGLYKQACATPPHGLACGLQGPFLEEYRIPPWSADYHFNINEQMIYYPTLATNRTSHLQPMWDLLLGWMPVLQKNGESFFGQKGALMIPHAVDDRCQVVGSFWTGTIDHACTAWMAHMAWLHYRYTLDEEVLEKVAWPLLNGAFEGFWAMREEVDGEDGETRLSLPVSVSPEFKGSRMDAWGRDASFQLAAWHVVAESLQKTAEILDKETDSRWAEVNAKLPPYTTFTGPASKEWPENETERIALWEGMDLISSHRHHSHLAAIYPFISIDPFHEQHREIVRNSINHWVYTGAGAWSGWCVPWAATLQARLNNADAAVGWLHYFKDNYTNEGRGTLHDAAYPGKSLIAARWSELPEGAENGEIMQLDGGFGALTATLEILVQNRRDGIYVLPDIPRDWHELTFKKVGAEGAFQIGAVVSTRQTQQVTVHSKKGGKLRLWHGLGQNWQLDDKPMQGEWLEIETAPGQTLVLERGAG